MGITPAGPFDVPEAQAVKWLRAPNPTRRPSSDILRPYFNGNDLTKRPRNGWTIDFGIEMSLDQASRYEQPFGYLESRSANPADQPQGSLRKELVDVC